MYGIKCSICKGDATLFYIFADEYLHPRCQVHGDELMTMLGNAGLKLSKYWSTTTPEEAIIFQVMKS